MEWYNPSKLQFSSVYGVFRGARGSGRIRAAVQRYGFDQLILQALRIRLRYPLGCPDIDSYIWRLLLERDCVSRYYFTDLFDPAAVTIRRVEK